MHIKYRDGSVKVNLQEPIQKLPIGQSLITVTEGQRAVMQVSLQSMSKSRNQASVHLQMLDSERV